MSDPVRYRVTGMDCTDCVAKIEKTTRAIPGVAAVRVSLTSQAMTLQPAADADPLPAVEAAITSLGYGLERIDGAEPAPAHLSAGYRRALWIVVLLNLGYGLIEIVGSYLAGSQALRADALDFLGDGTISLLGLLAIGWGAVWRARTALMQGYFLGLLGLGVLAQTLYRILVQHQPDADLMGGIAVVAFFVNIAAALVLMPHRSGDANVRAVWLFSRNDAIGNLVVVAAAAMVALLDTPWPDLLAALAIAGLFLHSAWRIITDAQAELTAANG